MGTYENLDGAVEQSVENLLSAFAFYDACQQRHADIHTLQKVHDGRKVLLGQDFRRGHNTGLITVVQRDEHRHQRYQRFPRTYIALQQAVHLLARAHILADFTDDALLGFRQWEGQVVAIEFVEVVAYLRKDVAPVFASLVAGVP